MGLLDRRRGKNSHYKLADIVMAAFSVFFMQSPSFLAHQRRLAAGQDQGRSNCEMLFGITRVPSDNHIRTMLDEMPPESFQARFCHTLAVLEAGGGLNAFCRLGHHVLIAFDGTEYFRSAKLHCACCSRRKRSGGGIECFHTLMAATLAAPGHSRVVPLQPEFVVCATGRSRQARTVRARRRWLAAHGGRATCYARLDPVYPGDELYLYSTPTSQHAKRYARRVGISSSSADLPPILPSRNI